MLLAILLQLFVFTFLFIVWAGTMYTFWLTLFYPPFVPTVNKKVTEHIEAFLESNPDITFFCEPGCGLAGVSSLIAKKFPKVKVLGIEYNYFIYLMAKIWIKITRSKVEIVHANFLKYNLASKQKGRETLIYCYLLSDLMNLAFKKGKFKRAQVVTLDFKITDAEATNILEIAGNNFQQKIYQYDFREKL